MRVCINGVLSASSYGAEEDDQADDQADDRKMARWQDKLDADSFQQ